MKKILSLTNEFKKLDEALHNGLVIRVRLEDIERTMGRLRIEYDPLYLVKAEVVIGKPSHGIIKNPIRAYHQVPTIALVKGAHMLKGENNGIYGRNGAYLLADGLVGRSLRLGGELIGRYIKDEEKIGVELVNRIAEIRHFGEYDSYFAKPALAKTFATAYKHLQASEPLDTSSNSLFQYNFNTFHISGKN